MHSPIGGRFPTLVALASLAAFGVATSGAQTSPSTPWVGRWVAEARGIEVVLWIEV
jgi:hypothetical protein